MEFNTIFWVVFEGRNGCGNIEGRMSDLDALSVHFQLLLDAQRYRFGTPLKQLLDPPLFFDAILDELGKMIEIRTRHVRNQMIRWRAMQ